MADYENRRCALGQLIILLIIRRRIAPDHSECDAPAAFRPFIPLSSLPVTTLLHSSPLLPFPRPDPRIPPRTPVSSLIFMCQTGRASTLRHVVRRHAARSATIESRDLTISSDHAAGMQSGQLTVS